MVRAPQIAQDRRRSLCAALKADLRDDDDGAKRRAARGLKLYAKEAQSSWWTRLRNCEKRSARKLHH